MNTKKLAIFALAIITATFAQAAKELVDGYTWTYTVANSKVTVTGVDPKQGKIAIPSVLGGFPVVSIGTEFLYLSDGAVSEVVVPEGVVSLGYKAFMMARTHLVLPGSLKQIGSCALEEVGTIDWFVDSPVEISGYDIYLSTINIYAKCDIWKSLANNEYRSGVVTFKCARKYASNWIAVFGASKFAGYIDDMPEVEIVSSAMRKDDPTVMDVVYKVYSSAQTVKVRAMAWENGERNLSKAIRPTKWIEGTEANIGDAVTANEEHKLSWRIAGDWATDLSKVKLEVLAVEDGLLPLELQTIPATATHQKMKISWNKMTADHVFDALLWLYADGDAGLTLTNGQLKNGANLLASGTKIYNTTASVGYVFGKMGYQVLAGDELAYARRVTQLELPVNGVQQFAVKYPDAK